MILIRIQNYMLSSIYIIIILSSILSQTYSTINPAWSFGNSTDRLVAVSAGTQHLTLVYAPNNDAWARALAIYNTTTNVSTLITLDTGMQVTKIKQIRGINTLSVNFWLVQYQMVAVSVNIAVVVSVNFTYMPSSWERNIAKKTFNVFGANTNITYQYDSTTGCQLNKKLGISNTSIIIQNNTNYTCYGLYYSSGIIYGLMYKTSTLTITLKFYNATTSPQSLISSYSFITPALYNNLFITASNNYYVLGYGMKIQVYAVLNRSSICNITLTSNIFDVKISNNWLYASTTTFIRQYKASTCMLFSQSITTVGYYLQYNQVTINGTLNQRLFAWTNTTGTFKINNIQDRYTCIGGCSSCMSQYGLDGVSKQCYYTGIVASNTTTDTTTNSTNTTNTTTTNTTTNTTNTTNTTTNTTNTTTNTTSNTTTNTTSNTTNSTNITTNTTNTNTTTNTTANTTTSNTTTNTSTNSTTNTTANITNTTSNTTTNTTNTTTNTTNTSNISTNTTNTTTNTTNITNTNTTNTTTTNTTTNTTNMTTNITNTTINSTTNTTINSTTTNTTNTTNNTTTNSTTNTTANTTTNITTNTTANITTNTTTNITTNITTNPISNNTNNNTNINTYNNTNIYTNTTNNTSSSTNTSSSNSSSTPPPTPTPPQQQYIQPPIQFSQKGFCFLNIHGYCQIFCSYKCFTCSPTQTQDTCTACSADRIRDDSNQCVMTALTTVSVIAVTMMKTFIRTHAAHGIFIFLDNLQLYQYHKTQYNGIIYDIFTQLNFMQSKKWSLVPFDSVTDWSQNGYKDNSYIPYTNQKYLEIQRKDSQFFQSTKAYYSIYVPISFIIFCILHNVFFKLSKWKISRYLRPYSFWLHFVVLTILANSTKLCYYAFSYFTLMFSISTEYKILHYISIFSIGIFLIFLLSLFFLSSIFYGNLSKYFLINVYRVQYAYMVTFFRFSVRPILQAVVHIFYFNNPQLQLKMISLVEIIFITAIIFCQINYSLFKSKLILLTQCVISSCIVILNFLLTLKHFSYEKDKQIVQNIQGPIQTIAYVGSSMAVVTLLHPFIATFFDQIGFKLVKKIIKTYNQLLFRCLIKKPKPKGIKQKKNIIVNNQLNKYNVRQTNSAKQQRNYIIQGDKQYKTIIMKIKKDYMDKKKYQKNKQYHSQQINSGNSSINDMINNKRKRKKLMTFFMRDINSPFNKFEKLYRKQSS